MTDENFSVIGTIKKYIDASVKKMKYEITNRVVKVLISDRIGKKKEL